MRYIALLAILALLCNVAWQQTAHAQCTNATSFGTVTLPTAGGTATINCNYAGEYGTWNGAVSGTVYVFTSTIATDFLTIRSGTPTGPVVAFGTQPITWISAFTGAVYVHVNTDPACGTASACRNITATVPFGCLNTTSYGSQTLPAAPGSFPTITCNFAGEYGTWSGAQVGKKYIFTSTIATDYLTVHTGSYDGPVVAYGTQPLTWNSSYTGTVYVHVNTNSSCGTAGTCRDIAAYIPVPNDFCTAAIPISCGTPVTGSTVGATSDSALGSCATGSGVTPNNGIWYVLGGASGATTISLCGSSYDTKLHVYSGSCAALTCIASNDDFCGLQSQVSFTAAAGTTYYVLVNGFGSATGSFTLNATCSQTPPCAQTPVTNTYTNSTAVAIPTGPGVVTSTITINNALAKITDVNLTTFITHTNCADLDITLTSPEGTVVTITTDNGGVNDNLFNGTVWDDDADPGNTPPFAAATNAAFNWVVDRAYTNLLTATPLVPEEAMGAFLGENPNGTWTLTISDDLSANGGNLSS